MVKFAVAAFAAALLCSNAAQAADLEVIHWWISGEESVAVQEVAKAFDATGDHWIDAGVAPAEAARATILQRILLGDPPEVAQFVVGREYEDLIRAGLLLDLSPVAEAEGWDDLIGLDAITAPCKTDGKWYCVPVSAQIANWGWASIPAFEEARGEGDIFVFPKQADPDVERAQLKLASLMVRPVRP